MTDKKKLLRAKMRRLRAQAHHDDAVNGALAAGQLRDLAAPLIEAIKPEIVAGYIPIANEIDARPLMAAFSALGARLCLPEVVELGEALRFREWTPGALLSSGKLGTLQPTEDAEILEPELVLLPLLAVDRRGVRLGQGGGFYDRTLEQLRERSILAYGVAFDEQLVDCLPVETHDQMLDGLITPTSSMKWDDNRQRIFLAQR